MSDKEADAVIGAKDSAMWEDLYHKATQESERLEKAASYYRVNYQQWCDANSRAAQYERELETMTKERDLAVARAERLEKCLEHAMACDQPDELSFKCAGCRECDAALAPAGEVNNG